MANYYYGINKGQRQEDVVVGTSTNSTGMELFITGTSFLTREEALTALENIENFLLQNIYPPA